MKTNTAAAVMPQTDFLITFDTEAKEIADDKALAEHRRSWKCCWDWDGPTVGGLLDVHSTMATLKTPIQCEPDDQHDRPYAQKVIYAYMEQARVLEIDGRTVTAVLEGNDYPGTKDGTVIILDMLDVWAPVKHLNSLRKPTVYYPKPESIPE